MCVFVYVCLCVCEAVTQLASLFVTEFKQYKAFVIGISIQYIVFSVFHHAGPGQTTIHRRAGEVDGIIPGDAVEEVAVTLMNDPLCQVRFTDIFSAA